MTNTNLYRKFKWPLGLIFSKNVGITKFHDFSDTFSIFQVFKIEWNLDDVWRGVLIKVLHSHDQIVDNDSKKFKKRSPTLYVMSKSAFRLKSAHWKQWYGNLYFAKFWDCEISSNFAFCFNCWKANISNQHLKHYLFSPGVSMIHWKPEFTTFGQLTIITHRN